MRHESRQQRPHHPLMINSPTLQGAIDLAISLPKGGKAVYVYLQGGTYYVDYWRPILPVLATVIGSAVYC